MGSYKACVLVTGGSGFLGTHTVYALLEGGYKVHTTTRSLQSNSAVPLKKLQDKYGQDALKLFEADLLKKGAFKESMNGVDAVFHVATPVMVNNSPDNPDDQIKPALEGTENILTTCLLFPRVKTIIVTSSTGTVRDSSKDSNYVFSEKDHNPDYGEDAAPYMRAKVLAEQYTWKFQEKHKDKFRLLTIHPSFILGPELVFEADDYDVKTGTNYAKETVFKLCNSELKDDFEGFVSVVDVRDVAKAHVLALESTSATGRIIIYAQVLSFRHIQSKMAPFLTNIDKEQYPGYDLAPGPRFQSYHYDNTKSKQVLGMKYRDVDDTLMDFAKQIGGSK